MKKIIFYLILSVLIFPLKAQEITGKVVDAKTGSSLSGVLVALASSQTMTVTDYSGTFSLRMSRDTDTLIVKMLSYKTKHQQVIAGHSYIIKLEPSTYELRQVVISATSSEAQNASVSLAKIDLNLKPVNTSQEILRIIPGLFIAQHEGGGKAEQIFLRGFDMDHGTDISVNVDGLPVNMVTHAHGQGYADLHFLIPETVERIEFEKGPYDVHYGDFQTGAFVNFRTKDWLKHNRIQMEMGMFNTRRLLTMFNIIHNQQQSAYIASEYMLTDGFFDRSQNFSRLNIFAKYVNNISRNTRLTAEFNVFKTRWDAAGLIPQRAVDQGIIDRYGEIDSSGGGITHRNNLIFSIQTKLSPHSHFINNFYFSDYAFNLFSDFTFYLHDTVNGDAINQREKRQIYGYNFHYITTNGNATFTLGGGIRYDDINDLELSHVKNRKLLDIITLDDVDETNAFFYGSWSYGFRHFLLTLGSRLDYFYFLVTDKISQKYSPASFNRYIISPKLRLSYSFSDRLQVYFKAGKGFHSNDARTILWQNQNLVPVAYGSDIGFIYRPVDNLVLSLAGWYLYLEQEYVFSGDEGTVEASGQTQRKGIDFSTHLEITPWLYARLDLNCAEPRNLHATEGAVYVPLAPVFSSVGGLYLRNFHGLTGSLTYRHLGPRPADEFNYLQTSPYTVFDASLGYNYHNFQIGIDIENLFNTQWKDAQFETTTRLPGEDQPHTDICFTPGTPFTLRTRLALRF